MTLSASSPDLSAVTATVSSPTEPAGETVTLSQTAPGVYTAEVPLDRRYLDSGAEATIAPDGRLSVYAEGSVETETLTVRFGDQTATVTYSEPPSTLMGTVRVGGTARARALVQLDGPAGFKRQTASRADGTYAFYEVPTGTYALTTAVDAAVPKTVTVNVP
ncbi:hypothetical protein D3C72_1744140 [compost metagenome]